MSEANTLQAPLTNEVRAYTLLRNVRLQSNKNQTVSIYDDIV